MTASFKHRSEYVFFRLFAALVSILPYRLALSLGWCMAHLLRLAAGKRVREARRRIREVMGPEVPDADINRIAWISLRNFCFNMIEVLRIRGNGQPWLGRCLNGIEKEEMYPVRKPGEGTVAVTVHTGNWELGTFMFLGLGYDMSFFYRPQKNELINRFFLTRREQAGLQSIPSDTPDLRGVVKQLREGRLVGILPDLRSRSESQTVDFLGKPANIGHGAAVFARMAKVPIVPIYFTRDGWARHRAQLLPAVYPDPSADRDADSLRMMQEVMALYTEQIITRPEQYFWYNKRWVLEPLKSSSSA